MAKAAPKTRAPTGPKKMSAYNKYMKDQLPKYKAANPGKNHKEAFRAVAELWAKAPENPKSAK